MRKGPHLHVIRNVLAKDVAPVRVGIKGLALLVIPGEPLLVVGDVKTTVQGSLRNRSKQLLVRLRPTQKVT